MNFVVERVPPEPVSLLAIIYVYNGFLNQTIASYFHKRVTGLPLPTRDCNPGPVFPIPGSSIENFVIQGPRRDYGISLRIRDLPL